MFKNTQFLDLKEAMHSQLASIALLLSFIDQLILLVHLILIK